MSHSEEDKYALRRHYRSRPSLFGPIVLIGLGIAFLLNNLGLFSEQSLNWYALVQLWPLWLILLGVNVIVRQAPGAIGSLLSAMVGLIAVAICGYILLFADDSPLLGRLRSSQSIEYRTETIEYRADDIASADIDIDFHSPGGNVYALSDSANLIEGTVTYNGDLIFDTSESGGKANVHLDMRSDSNDWFFFINPANWNNAGESQRWEIGLDPGVELNLTLDTASGSTNLDLSELQLSRLRLDSGSGSMEIFLPDGDYDVNHSSGSGSVRMTLPASGRQTIDLDSGSGSVTLYLPSSTEARIDLDSGSGSFNVSGDRFRHLSGDDPDDGIWETEGYGDAANRIDLNIDGGSGSIRIREP